MMKPALFPPFRIFAGLSNCSIPDYVAHNDGFLPSEV